MQEDLRSSLDRAAPNIFYYSLLRIVFGSLEIQGYSFIHTNVSGSYGMVWNTENQVVLFIDQRIENIALNI